MLRRKKTRAYYADRVATAVFHNLLYLGECQYQGFLWSHWGPMYEDWSVFKCGSFVGDPGCGKTSALLGLIRQAVQRAGRRPVLIFFLDLKGSGPEVARWMRHLAKLQRWRFFYFSPQAEYSHGFNIIENLAACSSGAADFAESLALGLQVGTGLDHQYFLGRAKREIRSLLRIAPHARTFLELTEAIAARDPKELADLQGLLDALEEWATVPSLNQQTRRANPPGQHRSIDCLRLVEQGRALVYVRLPRLRSLARTMIRVIKDATVKANSRLGTGQRTEVILIVDEFHRIAGDDLVGEVQALGRDVNLRLFLAFQAYSQIARVSRDLVYELLSMPSFYFGSADGGFSNRLFMEASTEEHIWKYPDRNLDYTAFPTLRARDLESLTESPGAFLARIPGARRNPPLRYGCLSHCMSYGLYESFRSSGFFERAGELPGAILNPQYDFFPERRAARRRPMNTPPRELTRALREAAKASQRRRNK